MQFLAYGILSPIEQIKCWLGKGASFIMKHAALIAYSLVAVFLKTLYALISWNSAPAASLESSLGTRPQSHPTTSLSSPSYQSALRLPPPWIECL
jgi:hypothetical protein